MDAVDESPVVFVEHISDRIESVLMHMHQNTIVMLSISQIELKGHRAGPHRALQGMAHISDRIESEGDAVHDHHRRVNRLHISDRIESKR